MWGDFSSLSSPPHHCQPLWECHRQSVTGRDVTATPTLISRMKKKQKNAVCCSEAGPDAWVIQQKTWPLSVQIFVTGSLLSQRSVEDLRGMQQQSCMNKKIGGFSVHFQTSLCGRATCVYLGCPLPMCLSLVTWIVSFSPYSSCLSVALLPLGPEHSQLS